MLPSIYDVPLKSFPDVALQLGGKPYVAEQLIHWLYRQPVSSFDEMSNLSKELRAALAERYSLPQFEPAEVLTSSDGTRKLLFRLHDGALIEAVFIPQPDKFDEGRVRRTLCISSQAGCAMGCAFCHTGTMGLSRHLTQGEIVGQILAVRRFFPDEPITNIVMMGMGEPMHNLKNVIGAVQIMIEPRALALSKNRVTVSSSGLIPQMREFFSALDVKVAISLHGTTDEIRNRVMPINRKYPLNELMEFCRGYAREHRRNRISFEYVMLKGVNDSQDDARRLAEMSQDIRAKVNLMYFNPFDGAPFESSSSEVVEAFAQYLRQHGIQVNVRQSRGQDIMAACGQLATTFQIQKNNQEFA